MKESVHTIGEQTSETITPNLANRTNAEASELTTRQTQTTPEKSAPRLPPRWFVRAFWFGHRRVYRLTGGRLGLWRPKKNRWGALRLNTIGRRSGREHSVMVGYFEDGPNLVTMAMNGWGKGEPAWWLNLQTHPEVSVDLPDGHRLVTGRAAQGAERERLWSRWQQIDKDLDAYAELRMTETAVVVLEPRVAVNH